MKWFLNPCQRKRESLCLLASGLLPEPDRVRIENHLAQCADCRSYYDEIKTVTAPLAGWEKHFAHVEPGVAVHTRLAKATLPAGKPASIHRFTPGIVLLECWQQLILPSRRIWTGLAAVWILIFVFNFSQRDRAELMAGKRPPSPEAIQAWQQQQRLLVELIGPNETRAARSPKPVSPQPRSERRVEVTAV
jgi:anti-sigma factor RsiW